MEESPNVYEASPDERVSNVVVRALADAMGTTPAAMDVRLYDVVDPDALDALFSSAGSGVDPHVSFSIAGKQVVVNGDRRVHVTTRNAPAGTVERATP